MALRPLSLQELQHAIAIQNGNPDMKRIGDGGLDDEELIFRVCEGPVNLDEKSGDLRVVRKRLP